MQTTIEFLNAVKRAYGLTSDYQLAKKLGVSRQMVSEYMAGKRTLGEETAVKVAELLELDWAYVVACVQAERSKGTDSRRAWAARAKKLAPATALLVLAGCSLLLGTPDQGAFDITSIIALGLCQVPEFNIHYAQYQRSSGGAAGLRHPGLRRVRAPSKMRKAGRFPAFHYQPAVLPLRARPVGPEIQPAFVNN